MTPWILPLFAAPMLALGQGPAPDPSEQEPVEQFLSSSDPEPAADSEDEGFRVPTRVEEAIAITDTELEEHVEGLDAAGVQDLLGRWMTLLQTRQSIYIEARAEASGGGDPTAAAQLGTERDVLAEQAARLLEALEERGGEDDGARATLQGIRAADSEQESSIDLLIDHAGALKLETEVLKALLRPLTLEEAEEQLAHWLELLKEKCIAVKNAEVAGLQATDPEKIDVNNALAVDARAERSRLIERVGLVIAAVEAKGGSVEAAEAYVSSVVVAPEITGLRAARTTVLAWLKNPDGGLALLRKLVLATGVLVVSWILSRLAGAVALRALRRVPKASELLREFVVVSARRVVLLLGVLMALGQLGVNMAPWVAAIGAAGLVVGLALQGTLSNFASGILIMVYRPFDLGDVVATAGPTGKVEGMTLFTTTVKTFDNQSVHIPNNMLWGDVITNITANDTRRVDMTFGIGYGDDVRQAKEILLEIATSHEKVLSEPEVNVQVHELADSSVNFIVRPWVRTEDYWDVYWDITQAVKERFDEEGVSIPFPQRDVHLFPQAPAAIDPALVQPAGAGSQTKEPGDAEGAPSETLSTDE